MKVDIVVADSAERPWGSWHTLDEAAGYKVKRIHVKPGQRLSYQTHQHRSEHWVVIFGIATCVVDDVEIVAGPGQSIDVAKGAAHRITNQHAEELVIIEVQHGAYTGEDDITRLQDDYGRTDCECDDDLGEGSVEVVDGAGHVHA